MIAIGNFSFPESSTVAQVGLIEAKSKVRKEIRIRSMLRGSAEEFLHALEAFDRGEESLSIHSGRYYQGRRRELRITPNLPSSLCWVDVWILTDDRYERSSILHQHALDTVEGLATFELLNEGNWSTPLWITLQPAQMIQRIGIVGGEGEAFQMDESIPEGSTVVIDAENRLVTLDSENRFMTANQKFPYLAVGSHDVSIQVEPSDVPVHCVVSYRDTWI